MDNQQSQIWTQRYTDYLQDKDSRPARIVYQRDRARVIHSASFRRLQAKTQIFGLSESDFYRTRLTHSMEVAQIGSGLVEQLITVGIDDSGNEKPYVEWLPSFYLIEAICLAHDLGHPPYGHGGEVALNYMMRHHGGFEGNAQTLRILAKLGEYTPEHGLDLSRRTALGVMKYPAIYNNVIAVNTDYQAQLKEMQVDDFRTLKMNRWSPPKSIYLEEKQIFDWVLQPFSAADRERFTQLAECQSCHQQTQYKALDTTIMELADDIAYGIHDLEDAVEMKMVSRDLWQAEVMEDAEFQKYQLWDDEMTERLFSNSSRGRKHAVSKMVGIMVEGIYMDENGEFEHPLLRYQARLKEGEAAVLDLLKRFVFKNVITIPEVKQMEYKGQLIVLELFKSLRANPSALLPTSSYNKYLQAETEQAQQRVISDYIAGMTNTYASRLYAKLFTPTQGSIFDRL
ncbi:anti-phage deoxyguanosine triphosphatase [Thiomicrorhabdus sediminis]|uniref:Deoxyguanosinetriphosphate triphosphohydrolase-like protein n=1 Tax=Thiomicrorhabdus sediminis TaxID=2580412 RepID=A0A4P9K4I7_9GAMM|nr:anti-phage deoxyguanosine triphosphatase [Thiomicrorhabdus sediminis]QCU89849.1 deoxyguanosinetriphosphate triphosphohydrolase family protein [Thiomicrorhabdus sediminis]